MVRTGRDGGEDDELLCQSPRSMSTEDPPMLETDVEGGGDLGG